MSSSLLGGAIDFIFNSPLLWFLIIGILAYKFFQVYMGNKIPEWRKPFFGARLLENIVVKDFKDTLNVLGIHKGIKIKDRFSELGQVKKIRMYKTRIKDLYKPAVPDNVIKQYQELKENPFIKYKKKGKKKSKKKKKIKSKEKDERIITWYEFLIRSSGFFGSLKSFFGFGESVLILQARSFRIEKGEIIINDNIKIEKMYGLYIVSCDEARKLIESVVWKIAHEEGLGNYMDYPRKLSYLTPTLPIKVEIMDQENEGSSRSVPRIDLRGKKE